MIRFVLDTDTCVFWLRGHQGVEQRILKVGVDDMAISIVTVCELTYGAWKSQRRQENLRVVDRLCQQLQILHTTNEVSHLFGRWKAQLENSGIPLDDVDLLIAAITHAHDCTLVTNNQSHFRRLPELAVDNWAMPSS